MKTTILNRHLQILAAALLSLTASGQVQGANPASLSGTISEIRSGLIYLQNPQSTTPARFVRNTTMSCIDDADRPVDLDRLQPGTPATVYYVNNGGILVATKVVVKAPKDGELEPAARTNEEKDALVEVAGTIHGFGSNAILLRSGNSDIPVSYIQTKSTIYIDEGGSPVLTETMKAGQRVTLFYRKIGDQFVISKAIFKR